MKLQLNPVSLPDLVADRVRFSALGQIFLAYFEDDYPLPNYTIYNGNLA